VSGLANHGASAPSPCARTRPPPGSRVPAAPPERCRHRSAGPPPAAGRGPGVPGRGASARVSPFLHQGRSVRGQQVSHSHDHGQALGGSTSAIRSPGAHEPMGWRALAGSMSALGPLGAHEPMGWRALAGSTSALGPPGAHEPMGWRALAGSMSALGPPGAHEPMGWRALAGFTSAVLRWASPRGWWWARVSRWQGSGARTATARRTPGAWTGRRSTARR
jgi:hypothetical protein